MEPQIDLCTVATSPYNERAVEAHGADLLVLSSDNVRFYVAKAMLLDVSPAFPFFHDPPNDAKRVELHHGLRIFRLSHTSQTLYYIFSFATTGDFPLPIFELDLFENIGLAAPLYFNEKTCCKVMDALCKSVAHDRNLNPFKCYSLSLARGWQTLASAAARRTLSVPLLDDVTTDSQVQQIYGITKDELSQLFSYRAACRDTLVAATIRYGSVIQGQRPGRMDWWKFCSSYLISMLQVTPCSEAVDCTFTDAVYIQLGNSMNAISKHVGNYPEFGVYFLLSCDLKKIFERELLSVDLDIDTFQ